MSKPTMDDLAQKVNQLQKKNRRLKWVTALLIVGTFVGTIIVADRIQRREEKGTRTFFAPDAVPGQVVTHFGL
jgi:hypothetical protein